VPKPLVARSPIAQAVPIEIAHGWEVSKKKSSAPLRLADLSQLAKIGVKAQTPPFDIPYGRSARLGDWIVAGSGPEEWTLLGPIGETREIITSGFATVIDLTHGRALMRLTGQKAPSVMEKVCSIDFSTPMCPNGAAFRASVANVVTDIVRDDVEGTRSYLVHCERSSGQFLFDALFDAGAEFGIDIEGFSWLQAGGPSAEG
jgi:heterotetrameric sarcosine oxidase gamma subunit